ncbi:MAG: rhodanese-like domain-containing protein [Acidimicrobiales bacterium]
MSVLSRLLGPRTVAVGATEARDLQRDGAVLLDVREQHEWDSGHVPKARHVPLGQLYGSIDDLPADRTIVVMCRSGNRSGRATKVLAKAGYDAVNLAGGIQAWRAAGLPVVGSRAKGRGARGRVT